MTVTMDYQAWTSTSYNWLDKTTATSAPLQINDKLVAWVAAVNANASNATKQIAIKKDPSSSISANYIGWVFELASASSGSTFYASLYSNATGFATVGFNATWTASTANGGYGAFAGANSNTTAASFYTSGQNAEFAVATETENGKEFFCLGWKISTSTTYSGTFLLLKEANGEWAGITYPGGSAYGTFYMPANPSPVRQYGIGALTVYSGAGASLDPLLLVIANTSYLPAAGNTTTVAVAAASPNLYASSATSVGFAFGRYCMVASGKNMVCMGYSPVFVKY